MRKLVLVGIVALAAAMPAWAVGLGPLRKEGVTDGARKGFYLTLINPYPARTLFDVYAVGPNDEVRQDRVIVPAKAVGVNSKTSRKILVVADNLAPGERYEFRVCAERANEPEGTIHARVCSRLVARRVRPVA